MNHAIRLQLKTHLNDIQSARASLEVTRDAIQELADAEREKFSNLSESLQESAKGQALAQAADELEELVSYLEDAICGTEDAVNTLTDSAAIAA